jgi:predicted HicB family RNase H-like nuclease
MKYKGYNGVVEFDEDAGILFGRVIGLRDVITFEGESVAEVIQAFHDSVDTYLEFCAERGESPEKPYSGTFVLRLDPNLHRELANAARARATSLNAFIEGILAQNLQPNVRAHRLGCVESVSGGAIPPSTLENVRTAASKAVRRFTSSKAAAAAKPASDQAEQSDPRKQRRRELMGRSRSPRDKSR